MPREGRDLTGDEIATWWSKLEHSHLIWNDAGLGDSNHSDKDMRRWFDYYRGDQAAGIGFNGIDRALGVIDNVLFSTANALTASLYARNPRIDVTAERQDRKVAGDNMERVVNHLVGSPRLRMRRTFNMVLLDGVLLPFAVLRHGFTLPEERAGKDGLPLYSYDPMGAVFPWIQRQPPWDFRCDTLGGTLYAENARWCAFRDLYPKDIIKKSPAFIYRDGLVATKSLIDSQWRKSEQMRLSPEQMDLIEVWTFYDKIERETFKLSPGFTEKAISRVKPWPIAWRTLPYNILQFNPTPDDPIGSCYSEQIGPLQDDLNRCLTLALELAKRQRRIIFVDENLAPEEKEKLDALSLMEVIFCANPTVIAKEVQVGGNFQELLLLAQSIKTEIRGLVGVSDMERGQRINVESAQEASLVGQGAALQRGRNQGPWEEFLADAIETFARGVQDTATQPIVVPILGAETTQQLFQAADGVAFQEIQPEQIKGEFQYRIRPGSTLPYNPGEDLGKEIALNAALAQPQFGEIINWSQRSVDTILAAEKDPSSQLMNQQQLQSLMQQRALAPAGEPGQAGAAGAPPQAVTTQTGLDPNVLRFLQSAKGGAPPGAPQQPGQRRMQ